MVENRGTVCAICDGIFRIRVIGTVLYYQSKWIPTSERDVQYIHTLYLLLFTSTVVVAVAVVLQLDWMTRLDWTGLDSHLSSCRTLVWTSLLILFIAPPLAGVLNTSIQLPFKRSECINNRQTNAQVVEKFSPKIKIQV